jgi:hypothetical protein
MMSSVRNALWSRPTFLGVPVLAAGIAILGSGSARFFIGSGITGVYFSAVAFNLNGAAEMLCDKLRRQMPIGRRTYTGDVDGVRGVGMAIVLASAAGLFIATLTTLAGPG